MNEEDKVPQPKMGPEDNNPKPPTGTPISAPNPPSEPVVKPVQQPVSQPGAEPKQPDAVPQQVASEPKQPADQPKQPASDPAQLPQTKQPEQPVQPQAAPQPAQPKAAPQPAQQPTPAPASQQQPAAAPQQPGPQQPGPQPKVAPVGYQAPVPQNPGTGKGTAALVCGIVALVCALLVPFAGFIIGIALGIVAIILATKTTRATGVKSGKTTAAKILSIIAFVVSVISLVVYIFLGVAVFNTSQSDIYGSSTTESTNVWGDFSVEEKAAAQPVDDLMKQIQDQDQTMLDQIATTYNADFDELYDFSITDMGLDPVDVARWATSDFSYSYDSATVFSDGTASVYVDATMRDSNELMFRFADLVNEYTSSDEYQTSTKEEDLAKLGELFQQAMDETTETKSAYVGLDLTQKAGAWTIDEDSWEDEFDYLFSVY